MKFGSKKAIFGVIWFFLRGLNLVRESATPPTHIWERYPKKNVVFFGSFPDSSYVSSKYTLTNSLSSQLEEQAEAIELANSVLIEVKFFGFFTYLVVARFNFFHLCCRFQRLPSRTGSQSYKLVMGGSRRKTART